MRVGMVTRFDEVEVTRIKEVSSGCIASITLQPILRERDGDQRGQEGEKGERRDSSISKRRAR